MENHFKHGAETVMLLILPPKVANTLSMDVYNQSPLQLPKMQSKELLTLG
jgi:hypothetical protein